MNKRTKLQWLSVAALGVAGALLSLRCVHQHSNESVEPAAASVGAERKVPAVIAQDAAATAEAEAEDLEQGAEPQPPEDEDEGDASLHSIAQYLRNSDAHDRDLLATIERETKKSPSPEVMELLSMRRAGAGPEELTRFIDRELGKDVRVRVAAKRWLRESSGIPAPPASPAPGGGGGTRRVSPIAPR
jgi:hypothetical protein